MFMLLYATAVIAIALDFGVSYGSLLYLSTPGFVLFGLAAIPAGWLGDRWSSRGMIAAQFIGLGATAIATGYAQTGWHLMAGLAGIGIFAAIYHPVGLSIIARTAEKRGRALGINGIFGGIGIASATWFAGLFTEMISWRAAFYIPGIISIATGIAFLLLVHDVPAAKRRTLKTDGASNRGWLPVMILILLVSAGAGVVFQTSQVAMPKIFDVRLSFADGNLEQIGRMVGILYLIGAIGQVIGGWMADSMNPRRAMMLTFGLQAFILGCSVMATDWILVALTLVLVTTTLGIQPIVDCLLANAIPEHLHGRAFGVRFVASLATGAVGAPLVGFVFDTTGSFTWLYVGLALTACVSVSVTFLFPMVLAMWERRSPT